MGMGREVGTGGSDQVVDERKVALLSEAPLSRPDRGNEGGRKEL